MSAASSSEAESAHSRRIATTQAAGRLELTSKYLNSKCESTQKLYQGTEKVMHSGIFECHEGDTNTRYDFNGFWKYDGCCGACSFPRGTQSLTALESR